MLEMVWATFNGVCDVPYEPILWSLDGFCYSEQESPVAVLEEQRNEAAENEGAEKVEDESKLVDADSSAAEPTRKNESLDEKPDINDVPMEESQFSDLSWLLPTQKVHSSN
ncbi:hypothetical protein SESBI_08798 [Sesbania bispinosa]|nr:hypothetical protein SESBI_08798 [Sesbania bispinosa]